MMQDFLALLSDIARVAVSTTVIVGLIWVFITTRKNRSDIEELRYYVEELVNRNNKQE